MRIAILDGMMQLYLLAIYIYILVIYTCTVVLAAGAIAGGEAAKQPHIVHILVDDLGWAEVGYHNKEVRTRKT